MEKEKRSPFEKYSGIGNPGIGKGREAIQRWLRVEGYAAAQRGELIDYVEVRPRLEVKKHAATELRVLASPPGNQLEGCIQ